MDFKKLIIYKILNKLIIIPDNKQNRSYLPLPSDSSQMNKKFKQPGQLS